MEVTLKSQIIVIIYSIIFGIFLGLIYHSISIISNVFSFKDFEINNKRLSKYKMPYKESIKSRVGLYLIDLFYFLLITPISAIFLFGINSGVVRGYIIAGSVVGFFLYKVSLGRLFGIFVNYASLLLQNMLLLQLKLIRKPIRAMGTKFKRKVKKKTVNHSNLIFIGKNREQG